MMMIVFRKSTVLPRPSGQLPVFEDLKQDVENVRMSLFDFVQEDNRIWRPAHAFGELSAFFIADIAWRRADQLRNGMLLHEFRHVEAHQRFFRAKEKFGKSASHFRFADARGPKEQEAANRTRG